MKTCSISDCLSPLLARGYCRKHYLRWYRHGDPLTIIDKKVSAARGYDLPQSKHLLWNHELYPTWHSMMQRCYRESNHKYRLYGARGIIVCERWHDVRLFVEDMHPRPKNTSLDRINNNGNYSPDNCRWATPVQQARNSSLSKISDETRAKILSLYLLSISPKTVSISVGVKPHDVKNVVYGEEKRNPTYREELRLARARKSSIRQSLASR